MSSEQVVEIDSGHEKVTLTCGVIGEDITGGYWEKVDGNLSSLHNKSKPLLHNHGKTILKMVIVRARPSNSGDYRCVVYNQWGVSKSRNVQVTIRGKEKHFTKTILNRFVISSCSTRDHYPAH